MSLKNIKLKRIIIAVLAILSVLNLRAETVSQKAASKIAATFFNTLYGEVTAPPKMVWNGRQLTTDRLFSPFYVYNSPKGGFVIISADNKAYPILAYSRNNIFDRSQLGENENDLFKRYAREIELVRYDSRVPQKAMDAWQDLTHYIYGVVENPYASDEYRRLTADEKEKIEEIDRRNSWIVMPGAIEFETYAIGSGNEITLDDVLGEAEEEEIPFKFYEDFLETVREENLAREAALDEMLMPTKPVVTPLGGGHFQISFPENVKMMRVYSMGGALVEEKYYKETPLVNINMESLPSGFYVGMVLTDSGKINGFKLFR